MRQVFLRLPIVLWFSIHDDLRLMPMYTMSQTNSFVPQPRTIVQLKFSWEGAEEEACGLARGAQGVRRAVVGVLPTHVHVGREANVGEVRFMDCIP